MSGKPCAGQICISFWHLFGTQDTEQHAHRQKQNIQSVWINAYGLWVPMGCLILVCSMFCPNLGSLGTLQGPTPDSLTAHARLEPRAQMWTLEPILAGRELGMMETHGFNQLSH